MISVFNGQQIDYGILNAEKAKELSINAQQIFAEQQFFNILKNIAEAASNGKNEICFNFKITDFAEDKLNKRGFEVIIKPIDYITITTSASTKQEYWTTIIKW